MKSRDAVLVHSHPCSADPSHGPDRVDSLVFLASLRRRLGHRRKGSSHVYVQVRWTGGGGLVVLHNNCPGRLQRRFDDFCRRSRLLLFLRARRLVWHISYLCFSFYAPRRGHSTGSAVPGTATLVLSG
jgi:hypothetical protein